MGINVIKLQGPSILVKLLEVQWYGTWQDTSSEQKLLHRASPINKKEAQCLMGLLGFGRQRIPHLDVLPRPTHQVIQKALVLSKCQNN